MKKSSLKAGISVVEVVVAIGIFLIISVGAVMLFIGVYFSSLHEAEKLQADMYMKQTFEAVRSIRDYNFSNLANGTYGLSRAAGYWAFSGSSDTNGQFTRNVVVSSVQRDASCAIVASGGTVDANSKKITATISWDYEAGNSTSISSTEYMNNWTNPSGCGSYLIVDTSAATLSGDGKTLQGITVRNGGASSLTITKITPTWSNSSLVEELKINNNTKWKHNGAGSPNGRQASGVELDITDTTLASGAAAVSFTLAFQNSVNGATFSLLFTMSDGSTKYVTIGGCGTQSASFVINTSQANVANKELKGITLQNTNGFCDVTIDKIRTTWSGGQLIDQVSIHGKKVWTSDGKNGSPSGKQTSGTDLNIYDTIISSNSHNVDSFKFDGNMTGKTFSLTFTMSDGSTKSTGNFSP